MQMGFLRRTWAEIDLDNLTNNYKVIRSFLKADTKLLAVVKANAYGHGDEQVASLLEKAGADFFGVSNVEEALFLRRSGITIPILILGVTPTEYVTQLCENNITQTVFSKEYANNLSECAIKNGIKVDCHVKVDSGMTRIGFRDQNEVLECFNLGGISVSGMFTHFAVADESLEDKKDYTKKQYDFFLKVVEIVKQNGFDPGICHCCNSAGVISYPEYHFDMVRPGIILYGSYPSEECVCENLLPVMQFKSAVSMVKWVKKGEFISYGCTFKAENDMLVATLPVGYADGYPRSVSNKAQVLIKGCRANVIGRVCMDQMMIDVTHVPNVKMGDVATLLGCDGNEKITAEEIAKLDGTISYEILCDIGRRVPRVYLKSGKVENVVNIY